jgi:E3 ubiquitin-protein ligase RNF144
MASMASATQEPDQDQEVSLEELIRGSVPDPPSSSSSLVRPPPLSDDEIGRFYCAICMEWKLVYDRFRATAACAHDEFCIACVVGHIEARVADGAVPVPCPAAGCSGATMHPEACKKLLDIDVFDAWCVALCERAIGPRRARCPYRDCGDLVALDAGCGAAVGAPVSKSKAACPGCSRAFCLQCEEPWDDRHSGGGEGCALDRLAEGRKWVRCPSCRAMIDKIDGCKSIVCR